MNFLVRRDGAFGDVLLTTPIMRRLRTENPNALIAVLTSYPGVFAANPDIDWAGASANPGHYDRVIDLNGAYEKRLRRVHPVDAYMEETFGDCAGDKTVVLARAEVPDLGIDWGRAIVIHPARSWRNRTLSVAFWTETARHIASAGYVPAVIGTAREPQIEGAKDARGGTPQQQATMIQAACAFVGSDSGVLGGLLPATDTPAVGLLTISTGAVCAPYRHGELGWRFRTIAARVPCYGCGLRMSEPTTEFGCERGDYACVEAFDAQEVAAAAIAMAALGRA